MRYIPVDTDQKGLAKICAMKCKCPEFIEPNSSIGIYDTKKQLLVGGVTYTSYTKREIWTSIWIDDKKSLTKHILKTIFGYAFDEDKCGVYRITTNTKADNKASIKLQLKLGFKNEGRMRRYFGDDPADDAIIMGMLKDECRWIKHG